MPELQTGERLQTNFGTTRGELAHRRVAGRVALAWISENTPSTQVIAGDTPDGRLYFTFEPPLSTSQLVELRKCLKESGHYTTITPAETATEELEDGDLYDGSDLRP